jgi:hypothetical protein
MNTLLGPYRNLQAGDVVAFAYRDEIRTAPVLHYLTFPTHVVVRFTPCGHVVDDSNFIRVVRSARGSVPYATR